MLLLSIFSLVLFFLNGCQSAYSCVDHKPRNVAASMYTLVLADFKELSEFIVNKTYLKEEAKKVFKIHLSGYLSGKPDKVAYLKAAALVSPFVYKFDVNGLFKFAKNFSQTPLFGHYLLFTVYKFYCDMSDSDRKNRLAYVKVADNEPIRQVKTTSLPLPDRHKPNNTNLWGDYQEWEKLHEKLSSDYLKAKKKSSVFNLFSSFFNIYEDDPLYQPSLDFIEYCYDEY
jgi:hypothetical protein